MDRTKKKKFVSESETLSFIVKNLSQEMTQPTHSLPSVEWVSENCIIHLLCDIRDKTDLPSKYTGTKMLSMLTESGLAKKLVIENVPAGKSPHAVYCLEFGGFPAISPAELLLSTQPDFSKTVLCYFTAITHHELSSQIPSHYNIARLKKMKQRSKEERLEFLQNHDLKTQNIRKPSLGTLLFHYEDTPYYETSRDHNLIPGIQEVRLRPSLLVRITTLEQTLLDTLHKPWSCGGPAVVFEAWQNGTPLIDDELLSSYLIKINRFDLDLRVGYMLSQFNPSLENQELVTRFGKAKKYRERNKISSLALLPNVPGNTYDEEWGLYV